MLNINVSFFNILPQFFQIFCPIYQQSSERPMQRTILAAVQATDETLTAPW